MHQPLGVFQDLQLSEIAPNLQFPELANNCARPAAALRDVEPEAAVLGEDVRLHEVRALADGESRPGAGLREAHRPLEPAGREDADVQTQGCKIRSGRDRIIRIIAIEILSEFCQKSSILCSELFRNPEI